MQGVQQADQIAARRAQAGAGRNVGHGDDLDRPPDAEQPQRFAAERVLEVGDVLDHLGFGVLDTYQVVHDRRVQIDEHVLVQRGGKDEAAMPGIVAGEVGATSAQGDPEGRTRNDHRDEFMLAGGC